MKNHLFFFLLWAGILFTSCQTTFPPLTDSQKAAIEKQILEQWDKTGIAVKNADAESFMTSFSTNEFQAMYSEGKQFLTRKEYADSVKVWFSARKSSEIQQPTIKVTVFTPTLVLFDQKSVFLVNLKDNRAFHSNHAVSFIYKKEDSGWKIIYGHESWNDF